jgi:peptide-methionine (R)-S-oxide reductase
MSEEDLRKKLNAEQYRVMRGKDDERPFSGKYWDNEEAGQYACAACGSVLFRSFSKFDAGTGWPSFKAPAAKDALDIADEQGGRRAVSCRECGGHVGYLFSDQGKDRYQANSAALVFGSFPEVELPEEDEKEAEAKGEDAKTEGVSPAKVAGAAQAALKSVVPWLASAAVGAVLGATGGMYLCRSGAPQATAPVLAPTSTIAVSDQSSALPSSVASPTSPSSPRSTITPASNAASSAAAPVPDPATIPSSAGTGGAADGTSATGP